ncbi:MAG: 4a-hydroxytetrahydrobiopterin dehydratase [Thermoplasmata archaeon]|nr:4a-hydroxytetrahydrobiopterin dehydratase [Thermoplasmata archaeon]
MKSIPPRSLVGWKIRRALTFRDFPRALEFVDRIGQLADSEGHHPDILIHSWNRVRLTLRTDAIRALSENDFILASSIDRLVASPG